MKTDSHRALLLLLAIVPAGGCVRQPSPERPAATPAAAPQVIVTKTGIEMVRLPAGEFLMGSDSGDDDERPPHSVRLSAFDIDVTEVTQESFEGLMGRNPSRFIAPDRPVDQVTWYDAVQYCNMRSLREGLTACYDPNTLECDFDADGYRLPTEAEWEYACRAGTATSWSFGDDAGQVAKHAWFKDNAGDKTHPVRKKPANPWGLYEMHGNLAEWCNDYYGETYESADEVTDPRGPDGGEMRVVRGGCWATGADRCRSSARGSETPALVDVCFRRDAYGFRCVRRAVQEGN